MSRRRDRHHQTVITPSCHGCQRQCEELLPTVPISSRWLQGKHRLGILFYRLKLGEIKATQLLQSQDSIYFAFTYLMGGADSRIRKGWTELSEWIVVQYFFLDSSLNVSPIHYLLHTIWMLHWIENHSFSHGLFHAALIVVLCFSANINEFIFPTPWWYYYLPLKCCEWRRWKKVKTVL